MQSDVYVFVSEHSSLAPFFTKSCLENENQASVRVSHDRALQIGTRLRDVEGIDDIQILRRRVPAQTLAESAKRAL